MMRSSKNEYRAQVEEIASALASSSAAGEVLAVAEAVKGIPSDLVTREGKVRAAEKAEALEEGPWQPWQHYIPVKKDLSDLLKRARWVSENPSESAAIAARAQRLASRYLSRQAAIAFLARELRWAAKASPAHGRHDPLDPTAGGTLKVLEPSHKPAWKAHAHAASVKEAPKTQKSSSRIPPRPTV